MRCPAQTGAADPPGALPAISPEWLEEFEAAAHRPLRTRWRYAFIRT
jgi:hypothetical protein